MNVAQLVRQAAYQARAVKQSLALGPSLFTAELYAQANEANLKLERALRGTHDDYFIRTMNSTDTTAQKIMGLSYTPSTSLPLAASTRTLTLPPDFLSLKSIRCVTSGYEDTRFFQDDIASQSFQDLLHDTDEAAPGDDLYYDILGERTFYLAQSVSSALDIEIAYVARTKRLGVYSTGTLAVTTATTAVAGTGTTWSSGTPFDSAYLDIHWGTSASATVPNAEPHYEYDESNRSRVSSITSDLVIVLANNKVGTLAAGTGYLLASVPVIPEDYQGGIADYVTGCILLAAGSAKATGYFQKFSGTLKDAGAPEARQISEPQVVEAWSPF